MFDIEGERQDVPGVEGLTVGGCDGEGSYLVFLSMVSMGMVRSEEEKEGILAKPHCSGLLMFFHQRVWILWA